MIYRRGDSREFIRLSLSSLKSALDVVESTFGADAVIQPNEFFNLAFFTAPGESLDRTPAPNGIGVFYAGYIDLANGDVTFEHAGKNNPIRDGARDVVIVGSGKE
jgi:hypothetical protein